MLSAILILLSMPFIDLSRSTGIQFKPLSKIVFFIFVGNFLILMELGAKHVESPFIEFGQISTVIYFSHFLIIVPLITLLENSFMELPYKVDDNPFISSSINMNNPIINVKSSLNIIGVYLITFIISVFAFNLLPFSIDYNDSPKP